MIRLDFDSGTNILLEFRGCLQSLVQGNFGFGNSVLNSLLDTSSQYVHGGVLLLFAFLDDLITNLVAQELLLLVGTAKFTVLAVGTVNVSHNLTGLVDSLFVRKFFPLVLECLGSILFFHYLFSLLGSHLLQETARWLEGANEMNNLGGQGTLLGVVSSIKLVLALESKSTKAGVTHVAVHKGTTSRKDIVAVNTKRVLNDGFQRSSRNRSVQKRSRWLSRATALASMSILLHHFPHSHAIRTLVVTHDLAGLEDGLFLGHFVPRTLLALFLEESSLATIKGGGDNLGSDTSLGSVIASFKFRLASKAKSTKLFVSWVSID
mmetsp:Transcript_20279/g.49722  ORF Transcript_20279/g.49722 Transcript_20279/m.49722 type:complete len:321 (+) Transcript_20279:103-1065(+)